MTHTLSILARYKLIGYPLAAGVGVGKKKDRNYGRGDDWTSQRDQELRER
jgi:uncharacterized membrane protein YjdF